jgi:hypothetical protein
MTFGDVVAVAGSLELVSLLAVLLDGILRRRRARLGIERRARAERDRKREAA